jgi:Protein of unknown function (DUF1573)
MYIRTILVRIAIFLPIFTILACQPGKNEHSAARAVEEITDEALINNSDIIRMPVKGGKLDTGTVAKLRFQEYSYDFGTVDEGKMVTKVFSFENVGKSPLVISDAHSTCGCTVPEFPEVPVPPGGKGEITVRFDTNGKAGPQTKPVTIVANTYPSNTVLEIVGIVRAVK